MTNLGYLKKNIIFHFFCDAKMNNSPVLIISNLKYNVYLINDFLPGFFCSSNELNEKNLLLV